MYAMQVLIPSWSPPNDFILRMKFLAGTDCGSRLETKCTVNRYVATCRYIHGIIAAIVAGFYRRVV
jgi:hypothetical protein